MESFLTILTYARINKKIVSRNNIIRLKRIKVQILNYQK